MSQRSLNKLFLILPVDSNDDCLEGSLSVRWMVLVQEHPYTYCTHIYYYHENVSERIMCGSRCCFPPAINVSALNFIKTTLYPRQRHSHLSLCLQFNSSDETFAFQEKKKQLLLNKICFGTLDRIVPFDFKCFTKQLSKQINRGGSYADAVAYFSLFNWHSTNAPPHNQFEISPARSASPPPNAIPQH